MTVCVSDVLHYFNRHELDCASNLSRSARVAISYFSHVEVDQHALEVMWCFGVRDDDVVWRDIAVDNVTSDVERLVRFDRISH